MALLQLGGITTGVLGLVIALAVPRSNWPVVAPLVIFASAGLYALGEVVMLAVRVITRLHRGNG